MTYSKWQNIQLMRILSVDGQHWDRPRSSDSESHKETRLATTRGSCPIVTTKSRSEDSWVHYKPAISFWPRSYKNDWFPLGLVLPQLVLVCRKKEEWFEVTDIPDVTLVSNEDERKYSEHDILISSLSNQNICLGPHRITKHLINKCNLCQTEFMTEYDLKTHIESTHTVRRHICDKCQNKFSFKIIQRNTVTQLIK